MQVRNPHIENFNIRVYGIWIFDDQVLIAKEDRFGISMVKFPGGGLEKGEGIEDCLIREFQEELGVKVLGQKLFYVNPFFQQSAFRKTDQLISFYYLVEVENATLIAEQLMKTVDFGPEAAVNFEWIKIEELKTETMTFPIDRVIINELKKAIR